MGHMNFTDLFINLIAAAAFLGYLTFMIVYATRNWRSTDPGKAVMYAIAGINAVLLMVTIHLFTGPYPGIEIVRVVVYGALAITSWSLVATLARSIRKGPDMDLRKLFSKKDKKP